MANLTDADKVLRNDVGKNIVQKLNDLLEVVHGGNENLAPTYDSTQTYYKNDKVIYQNNFYRCVDDNSGSGVTGAFDLTKWMQTTISALTAEELPLSGNDSTPTATAIGDLSYLTTSHKSSLVDAVNELDSDLSNLPTEIRSGIGNYSGLKGGGHPNRVTVPITFSTPMKNKDYAVFIVISDAYPDYPYVQGYCFGGSRTANGFTATILSISSDTTTEVSGSFYWVAVRYK